MNVATKSRVQPIDIDEPPAPQLPAVRAESAAIAPVQDIGVGYFPPTIAKALVAIQRGIGAIQKGGRNTFHNYDYQKWEDVLNALSPLIADSGLIILPTEVSRSLFENDVLLSVTYEYAIVHENGDVWPERPRWSAIAKIKDNKGQVDDKAVNKCHTQAHKYFLLHLFNIRTQDAALTDSDADGPVNVHREPARAAAAVTAAISEPHTLSTDTKFEAWTDLFVRYVEQSRTADDVRAWHELNEVALSKIGRSRSDLREEISRAAAAKLDALDGAGQPDDDEPPAPTTTLPAVAEQPTQLEAFLLAEISKLPGMQRAVVWAKEAHARIQSLSAPAKARVDLAFLQKQQEFNPTKSRKG